MIFSIFDCSKTRTLTKASEAVIAVAVENSKISLLSESRLKESRRALAAMFDEKPKVSIDTTGYAECLQGSKSKREKQIIKKYLSRFPLFYHAPNISKQTISLIDNRRIYVIRRANGGSLTRIRCDADNTRHRRFQTYQKFEMVKIECRVFNFNQTKRIVKQEFCAEELEAKFQHSCFQNICFDSAITLLCESGVENIESTNLFTLLFLRLCVKKSHAKAHRTPS